MTDPALADHTASDRHTRRALLGAGALGAVLAVAGARAAAASTSPSDDDEQLLAFGIAFELTARDLYEAAIEAGATGSLWEVLREQHKRYAHLLAGIAGLSADERNDEVFDALVDGFRGPTTASAFQLENIAAATHAQLLGTVESTQAAGAIASIIAIESRHATVLALQGDRRDDLDALFSNPAMPLTPGA